MEVDNEIPQFMIDGLAKESWSDIEAACYLTGTDPKYSSFCIGTYVKMRDKNSQALYEIIDRLGKLGRVMHPFWYINKFLEDDSPYLVMEPIFWILKEKSQRWTEERKNRIKIQYPFLAMELNLISKTAELPSNRLRQKKSSNEAFASMMGKKRYEKSNARHETPRLRARELAREL